MPRNLNCTNCGAALPREYACCSYCGTVNPLYYDRAHLDAIGAVASQTILSYSRSQIEKMPIPEFSGSVDAVAKWIGKNPAAGLICAAGFSLLNHRAPSLSPAEKTFYAALLDWATDHPILSSLFIMAWFVGAGYFIARAIL